MSYKYNFTDNMYVAINSDKFKKVFFKKHSYKTGAEILNKEGYKVTSSGLSTSVNRGIVNYGVLKILCRDLNAKPATFITSNIPVSNKAYIKKEDAKTEAPKKKKTKKKTPVKKPAVTKDENKPQFTGDGALNVQLSKKSDHSEEIVKALNEIRDCLRELVEELK